MGGKSRRPDYARIAKLEQDLGMTPSMPALAEAGRRRNKCPAGHPYEPGPESAYKVPCPQCDRQRYH